jgi:peroxidase
VLFPEKGLTDLAAVNIQRGRDHGLPEFNQFRKLCELPVVASFSDVTGADLRLAKQLHILYGAVGWPSR